MATFTQDKSGKTFLDGKPLNGIYKDIYGNSHTYKDGIEITPSAIPAPSSSATPTPKPSVTGAAATGTTNSDVKNLNFTNIDNGGGNQQSGWTGAAAATFSTGGIVKGYDKPMTGDQLLQAFETMAHDNDPQWSSFRNMLINTIPGYNLKDLKSNWSSQDTTAVKQFLTTLNNYNTTKKMLKQPTLDVQAFAVQNLTNAKKTGTSFSTLNATSTTATPLIPVPATADLADVANKAFTTTLGRTPTAAESSDFAKKYQDLVLSYGNAKVSAKKNAAFEAKAQPVQFQEQGTPVAATTVKNPVAATNAIMEPPTVSTAASNYASNVNPVEAGANSLAGTVNNILSILKG